MKLEFSYPDKYVGVLNQRLRELRREGISKSAFCSVAILKALNVDAELWPRGHRAPKDNGAERDEDDQVRNGRPRRSGPDLDDDGDEEVEEDEEPEEVPDAQPDFELIVQPSGAPPVKSKSGRCASCGQEATVFPHPFDNSKLICETCLDRLFWS